MKILPPIFPRTPTSLLTMLFMELPTGLVADVRFILLHELFHALGSSHESNGNLLMYPTPTSTNIEKWNPFFEIEKFNKKSCADANFLRKEVFPSSADTIEDYKLQYLFPVRKESKQLKTSKIVCNCGFDHVTGKAPTSRPPTTRPSKLGRFCDMEEGTCPPELGKRITTAKPTTTTKLTTTTKPATPNKRTTTPKPTIPAKPAKPTRPGARDIRQEIRGWFYAILELIRG